jgi:hypothetical protein
VTRVDLSACACPFCGRKREHTPPRCHRPGCNDGAHGAPTHRVEVRVAEIPPPNKDVAELLGCECGDAVYAAMLRDARPGPSWMIAHLDDVGGHDLSNLRGTALRPLPFRAARGVFFNSRRSRSMTTREVARHSSPSQPRVTGDGAP